ncbi:MAG: hypothetical protein Q9M92_13595 [Enterobacterales bacterium]|nr:hypothetical protein [Enterobacterales bacterium]
MGPNALTPTFEIAQMRLVRVLKQEEVNINADFSTPVGDSLNVAYGAEWREETYTTIAGEANSYINGGVQWYERYYTSRMQVHLLVTTTLFMSILSKMLVKTCSYNMPYVMRNFSDFGSTVNWKVASRYTYQ